ncbi:PIN domain-containing protein [Microcella humidisoli]|uniref:PIN domain-containing protein n=1 Tax=Microcella humidisoli TaxID=2963406 RepID=A0ABY5FVG8_9MICO|nr:PIN domain-containing protein [Microcella humidisoli]UTT62122.1 PIN domain-containing protein [Microcella humidisoli]
MLDTNVVWPSLQRDFLLSLHIQGAYRAVWSEAILEELEYHEALKLMKRGVDEREAEQRAHALIAQMREHFSDSVILGWEGLDGTFGLPDPDDEHVVAAAVVGGAEVIVTENLRHFPAELLPAGIEVLGAAEFARNTVDLSPRGAIAAVDEIVARSGRLGPQLTREGTLDVLETRYGMVEAVRAMREYLGS